MSRVERVRRGRHGLHQAHLEAQLRVVALARAVAHAVQVARVCHRVGHPRLRVVAGGDDLLRGAIGRGEIRRQGQAPPPDGRRHEVAHRAGGRGEPPTRARDREEAPPDRTDGTLSRRRACVSRRPVEHRFFTRTDRSVATLDDHARPSVEDALEMTDIRPEKRATTNNGLPPRLHTRPPGTRVRALRAVDRLARVGRPSHRARTDRDRERSGRRRDAGGSQRASFLNRALSGVPNRDSCAIGFARLRARRPER